MEITGEMITALIGIIATVIAAWASHYFTRKKYNAEVDSNLIENLQHSLEFYKNLVDDNTARLNKVIERNKELELEVEDLREQVQTLKSAYNKLKEKGASFPTETVKQVKAKAPKDKTSNTKKHGDSKEEK